jgi:hypothetical protein
VQITPEFTQIGDKIIGSAPWPSAGGTSQERFMVFTISADRIVDMQGFTSRREAERFARK